MELQRYTQLFLSEAREHFSTVNRLLLALEKRPDDLGAVDEIFRTVHTLKGAAAAMGYGHAAELAHALEHLLDGLRKGVRRVDADAVDLLLQATDVLERAVERPVDAEDPEAREVLARLQAEAPRGHDASPAHRTGTAELNGAEETGPGEPNGRERRVRVTIAASSALPAVRAVMVLRNARALGTVRAVEPDESRIQMGELEGEISFLLDSGTDDELLRASLAAAGEVEAVEIEPVVSSDAAVTRGAEEIVRVRQGQLDALVDRVGELMIARDRLRRAAEATDAPELHEAVEDLSRLIGELRDRIMRLRSMPFGDIFDRFPRLVRDAARALGKEVELQMDGRSEEVDRRLLNEVADLLIHLLRNAVDHGIEVPEEREAAGKPSAGRVRLSAAREASAVVIRVEDDGRGLQRDRIVRAALERGLLEGEQASALSDDEVYHLITRPGFSTAERVTDVSGRGVGMDVVHSRVQALGGSLEIRSREGAGVSFTLRLPLSLSIVRTLLVEAAGEVYCVPLGAVSEVGELAGEEAVRSAVAPWRDGSLPLVDLFSVLAPRAARASRPFTPLVVVDTGKARFGVLVEALRGHHEAVVKPFDGTLQMTHVFSGATVLADGRPALILDPAGLAARIGTVAEPALA